MLDFKIADIVNAPTEEVPENLGYAEVSGVSEGIGSYECETWFRLCVRDDDESKHFARQDCGGE